MTTPPATTPVRPSLPVVAVAAEPTPTSAKKADIIDLTLDSSSSENEEEEEQEDAPLKKRCLFMTKTEDLHSKGSVHYFY